MIRAYIMKLETDGQTMQVMETEEGLGVEFVFDGGGFTLTRDEAKTIVDLIAPNSYSADRIKYKNTHALI